MEQTGSNITENNGEMWQNMDNLSKDNKIENSTTEETLVENTNMENATGQVHNGEFQAPAITSNEDSPAPTETTNEEFQAPAEITKHNELVAIVDDLDYHQILAKSAIEYLPTDIAEGIINKLAELDHIEKYETLEAIELDEDNLTPEKKREIAKLKRELSRNSLGGDLLTLPEARKVSEWANDKTQEVRDQKARMIADQSAKILNGVHNRRDYNYNIDKARKLDTLIDKYERWERGEIDTSLGIDLEEFLDEGGLEESDFEAAQEEMREEWEDNSNSRWEGFLRDKLGIEGYIERKYGINIEELPDMIESEDLPDERMWKHIFIYGPYTSGDLRNLSMFSDDTYVDAAGWRTRSQAEIILSANTSRIGQSVSDDLNRAYVEKEILPKRRLDGKKMLYATSALGIKVTDILKQRQAKQNKDLARQIRKKMETLSYYMKGILGMNSDDLEKRYGNKLPINKEFYQEVMARAQGMTEFQEETIDDGFNQYLIKMDDNLFEVQALLETWDRKSERERFQMLAQPVKQLEDLEE